VKAVERKQRKVRLARTDRLKANTAFTRERAVFIAAGEISGVESSLFNSGSESLG